ncbi:uncharacterized protein LOC106013865 [Aplysia californica]|uniref:Uncharacterized protein LOC106013865 n=1 Tax=Aplysia californica TaxID=6500 RepID=A0ABM1AEE5_APLCA|nr:uncharacterized protein LOC106013865 [Aplysia californica]
MLEGGHFAPVCDLEEPTHEVWDDDIWDRDTFQSGVKIDRGTSNMMVRLPNGFLNHKEAVAKIFIFGRNEREEEKLEMEFRQETKFLSSLKHDKILPMISSYFDGVDCCLYDVVSFSSLFDEVSFSCLYGVVSFSSLFDEVSFSCLYGVVSFSSLFDVVSFSSLFDEVSFSCLYDVVSFSLLSL